MYGFIDYIENANYINYIEYTNTVWKISQIVQKFKKKLLWNQIFRNTEIIPLINDHIEYLN